MIHDALIKCIQDQHACQCNHKSRIKVLFIDEKGDEGHDNNAKGWKESYPQVEKWNPFEFKTTS